MKTAKMEVIFNQDIKTVWQVITNNEDYTWRSDLQKIEVKNEKDFIEIYPNGNSTQFHITKKEPYQLYTFDMDNKNFRGNWIGEFESLQDGKTKVIFTENIQVKNPIMRILATFFMNIQKIQEQYVADLKKKLGE